MKIIDLLKSDKVTVSFEVFPPKSEANYESIYNAVKSRVKCEFIKKI